ncbi:MULTISPECIES: hypothetical protein [unclassified Nocardia]|uniref:hypothetical protein n=1 Tax=unclassified Nocardia TaxID=2637762 RepID=UPI001CE3BF5D|nr:MULTISPECIES: hypothetical protein [unclassified Nocardia]
MVDRQSQENSDEIAALAQRVAVARGKLPLQHDSALFEVLSEAEIDAERELAEWVRAKRRGQRRRAVADELAAEKRDRRTARHIERAADEDARWHRRALAARRRAASQDARLAQLYRRAEWSARALIGVVVLGMVWAGVNVQHNLVPSGDMTDPLYWLSYGIEAMISIPIITIMVVATTAARWGRDLDRGKVVFFETALLGTTIALNAGPHLAAGEWGRAAEYAIAPIMVGVVIWLHAWVSARYAMLIDGVPVTSDDEAPAPRRHITTERGAPVTAPHSDDPTGIRELAAVNRREPTAQLTARLTEFDAQHLTGAAMRNLTNTWPPDPARVDHTETLLYHAQSTTRARNRPSRPVDEFHSEYPSRTTHPNASITDPTASDAPNRQQPPLRHNGFELDSDTAQEIRARTSATGTSDFVTESAHSTGAQTMPHQAALRHNGFETGPARTSQPQPTAAAQSTTSSGAGPISYASEHRAEQSARGPAHTPRPQPTTAAQPTTSSATGPTYSADEQRAEQPAPSPAHTPWPQPTTAAQPTTSSATGPTYSADERRAEQPVPGAAEVIDDVQPTNVSTGIAGSQYDSAGAAFTPHATAASTLDSPGDASTVDFPHAAENLYSHNGSEASTAARYGQHTKADQLSAPPGTGSISRADTADRATTLTNSSPSAAHLAPAATGGAANGSTTRAETAYYQASHTEPTSHSTRHTHTGSASATSDLGPAATSGTAETSTTHAETANNPAMYAESTSQSDRRTHTGPASASTDLNPATTSGAADASTTHAEIADAPTRHAQPTSNHNRHAHTGSASARTDLDPAANGGSSTTRAHTELASAEAGTDQVTLSDADGSANPGEATGRATAYRTESTHRDTDADDVSSRTSAAPTTSGPATRASASAAAVSEPVSSTAQAVRSTRRVASTGGSRSADDSEGALESRSRSEQLELHVDADPVESSRGRRTAKVAPHPATRGSLRAARSEAQSAPARERSEPRPIVIDRGKSAGARSASEVIREAAEAISAEELAADAQLIEPENDDAGIWAVARAIVGRGLSPMPVEQLAEILTLADQSWTPTSIGAEVGLSRSAIAQVLECARKVRRPYAISG